MFACKVRVFGCSVAAVALLGVSAFGQEPSSNPPTDKTGAADTISAAALAGSKQDPSAVERGSKVFRANCAGCHGQAAKGGPGAPDLVRSVLVLDDEKGLLIGPVIREGRPDKGMPKLNLTEAQIADVVAWLHVRTYAAGHRNTYAMANVVTGNAEAGKQYFGAHCSSCHSGSGDLAGIGRKYDGFALQGHWLQPRGGRPGASHAANEKASRTVTVTLASGKTYTGTLEHLDDFTVALRDGQNQFHSFYRNGDSPKITVKDPLEAHSQMLHDYTDSDIHNVTAYLASLK